MIGIAKAVLYFGSTYAYSNRNHRVRPSFLSQRPLCP